MHAIHENRDCVYTESKKSGKDQESILSSTALDQGYQ